MTTTHDKAVHARECKGSIPIVPFRYAIMPKVEGDKTEYYYDACPTKLDKGFDKLDTAAYSIRTLRPGYIYLYDEDLDTTYLWEADGEGNYTSLQWTSLEDYGKKSNEGSPMQNITVCDESHNVYIAYSQDLWSRKGLEKNIKNKNKFMVKLDIQEILNGSKSKSIQENVLPSDKPEEWVEEYKTPKGKYEEQFGWSSSRPENIAQIANLKALATPYADMHKPKLPVFIALYDSVATAIDMGHIATLHMQQLYDIKELQTQKQTSKQVYKSIPVEMRLDTTKLKSTSAKFYRKKMIADIIDAQLKATFPSAAELQKEGYGFADLAGATRKAKEVLGERYGRSVGHSEAQFYSLQHSGMNTDSQRVVKHIDVKKLETFHKEKDLELIRIKKIRARVKQTAKDSTTVLKTMESNRATHPRNIASVLATYDRNNIWSATALEQSIAHCIKGMGTPIPGDFKIDPRFELLGKWVETPESPIYVGIKAYNPFKKKIDSIGDLVGGSAGLIAELGDSFKALPATNIIVKEISTYSIYKVAMMKATVTDSSLVAAQATLVVESVTSTLTASGGNIKELFKVIQGRYGIVTSEIMDSKITGDYTKMMAVAGTTDAIYAASLEGSRTSVTSTRTTRVKAQPMSTTKLRASITSSGISAGAAIFHAVNLEIAIGKFSHGATYGTSFNLGSALFGTMGAFAELIVAVATTKQKIAQRITGKVAIKAAGKSLLAKASGPIQFIAAFFEAGSHAIDAGNLYGQGDDDAAIWAGVTAVTLGTAGALGGIGTLVAAGAISSTIPVAGWIAAAIIFTIAGIGFLFVKLNKTDRPMEVWVSRTVFGNPRTKFFSGAETDIAFADLSEELSEYYTLTLSPIKLDDAKNALSSKAESDWEEHGVYKDEAKFTFLLPAYAPGISDWSYKLNGYEGTVDNDKDRDSDTVTEADLVLTKEDKHERKLKKEGLYIYLSKTLSLMKTDSAGLEIIYWPQGKNGMKIVNTLYVAD